MRMSSFLLTFILLTSFFEMKGERGVMVSDVDEAKEICNNLPLETVEGIWLYPEDMVKVLILNDGDNNIRSAFPSYTISVVETSDARLHPGDIIGKLIATPDAGVFRIQLATEKRNNILLKPITCVATLGKEGDSFIFKRSQSGLKGRFNINLNRLLPGFWKIISTGLSVSSGQNVNAPIGMVKLYPSYDGNGSSRTKIRYL